MGKSLIRRLGKKFFLSINILIVILYIVSCYGWWFNPSHFWLVSIIVLGALYLFVVLLIFLIFWLFIKPKFMLLGLLAILLSLPALHQLIGIRFSGDFKLAKDSSTIRVMTWNVEHFEIIEQETHPEKKQEMLQTIVDYSPDIACFQEMVGSDTHPEAYNYIPDISARLKMPYTHYSYNNKLDYNAHHHFGIMIFSRLPIIKVHTLSYAPNDYNSIFQYVDLLKGSDTIRVFNLHLQSLKFDKSSMQYLEGPTVEEGKKLKTSLGILEKFKVGSLKRKLQSDRIKKAVNESPYPAILCGDFNDVPNSYAYHTIGKDMKNVFVEKGKGIGRTFSAIAPTLRIDNIFVSRNFDVLQYTRVKRKMSDHFPVISDLKLKEK